MSTNKALRGRHLVFDFFPPSNQHYSSSSMNGERDKSVEGGKKRVGKKNLASTFDLDSTTLLLAYYEAWITSIRFDHNAEAWLY